MPLFESGERYLEFVLTTAVRHVDPTFRPTRALDFGCGVGRVPSRCECHCDEVVGVDVSTAMLDEATANASRTGIDNVSWVLSDDRLSRVKGTFDIIHSFIVFQHIRTTRGMRIIAGLLDRLRPDGVGILHVTYAYSSKLPRLQRALITEYGRSPWRPSAATCSNAGRYARRTCI